MPHGFPAVARDNDRQMKSICRWLVCLGLGGVAVMQSWAQADVPVSALVGKLDPATGQASEKGPFKTTGVISARLTLPDDRVVAFLQVPGERGLPLVSRVADAALLVPRNEVMVTGGFVENPLGGSALEVKAGAISLSATNKPFGSSELRGAAFMSDASSLQGRYVQLTNVTFAAGALDASGVVRVKAVDGGAEAVLMLGKAAGGRVPQAGPVNVYGIPVKVGKEWRLLTARILAVSGKVAQTLAMKHTCFTCHNPDTKMIGPAYRDVAAKYRNDPDAEAKLISQMETGGSGKWGPVPMIPFKGKVPPEDMKQLAEWIMGYRWDAVLAE